MILAGGGYRFHGLRVSLPSHRAVVRRRRSFLGIFRRVRSPPGGPRCDGRPAGGGRREPLRGEGGCGERGGGGLLLVPRHAHEREGPARRRHRAEDEAVHKARHDGGFRVRDGR